MLSGRRWQRRRSESVLKTNLKLAAVMGLYRLPCTVCERVGERRRDGAGSLLTLGYRVTKMAQVVDAVDFRPSRNGDGTVPAAAHSL